MNKYLEYENTAIHKMMVEEGYVLDSINHFFEYNSPQEPSAFVLVVEYDLCYTEFNDVDINIHIELELDCATSHDHDINDINVDNLNCNSYSIKCNTFCDDNIFTCKIILQELTTYKLKYYKNTIDQLFRIHYAYLELEV